jgi:hypothetical protein
MKASQVLTVCIKMGTNTVIFYQRKAFMKATSIKVFTVCISMGTNTMIFNKRSLPSSFNRRSRSCKRS